MILIPITQLKINIANIRGFANGLTISEPNEDSWPISFNSNIIDIGIGRIYPNIS